MEKRVSSYTFILQNSKNTPIHSIHCILQLKGTLVAVKHSQLLFLFTLIRITGGDYQNNKDFFRLAPCAVCYELNTLLAYLSTHFDVCIT